MEVQPPSMAEALDVVVVRGHRTATAIGVAAKLAKAKTTTLVLWDRRHRSKNGDSQNVTEALEKKVFQVTEEERPDAAVMSKAMEYSSSGAPKCAVLHVSADKMALVADVPRSLHNPNGIINAIKENHMESLQAFYV